MSDTDLAKRVCELEERVTYLEKELDISIDEKKFERKISRIAPRNANYEIVDDDARLSKYSAILTLDPHNLPHVSTQVESHENIAWSMEESSEDEITIKIQEGVYHE